MEFHWRGENIIGDIINKAEDNYKDHYKVVEGVITVTLYAGWRENVKPELTAVLMAGQSAAEEQKWYPSLSCSLTYSDNVGVTGLYVKEDEGEYTELPLQESMDAGTGYDLSYNEIEEGEHTYTFRAVDAAGNVTETGGLTARLDMTEPVLGNVTLHEGYKDKWSWIIGRDKLSITVPVTEAGSGIDAVEYTLTSADAPGSSVTGRAKLQEISGRDGGYMAEIYILPDFKGTVSIIAKDKAGNVSGTRTIGADSDGIRGVIVEDDAPAVTILADRGILDEAATQENGTALSDEYYHTAPNLLVTVEDAGLSENGAVVSGLDSISWRIGDGEENPVSVDFQSAVRTSHSFTINALEGSTGSLPVTVTAVDQAGNETQKTVMIHIWEREEAPQPEIDYREEKLTGLQPGAAYEIQGETITADEQGCIDIREPWFGNEVQISRKGGEDTLDSESTTVNIKARPAAPAVTKKSDETIRGKRDGAVSGLDTAMEYSMDGGVVWVPVKDSDITGGVMDTIPSGEIRIRTRAVDTMPCGQPVSVSIAEGRELKIIFETNGGSSVTDITGLQWKAAVREPAEPVKGGYVFEGWYRDPALTDIWHFAAGETEADRLTEDVILYAKWRDNEAARISAVLMDGDEEADDEGWHRSLSCTLTYSDNVGVEHLYVKKDDGEYTELPMAGSMSAGTEGSGADGQMLYNDIEDGVHTYVFRAVDAAGNATETRGLVTRLDTTKPVLGEAVFSEDHREKWNRIISREDLLITIPVTEEDSGIDTVEYTMIPADDQETADVITGKAEVRSSGSGTGYTAVICIEPDFKGRITVTAKDKAGFLSDTGTIGADGSGIEGVIVENDAPEIRFAVDGGRISEDYYDSAPAVTVYVADQGNEQEENRISSGIASVTWQLDNGEEMSLDHDYTAQIQTSDEFTIPADDISTGVTRITIRAADYAGNETVQTVTVRVKGAHKTPDAGIDYQEENLTGLEADGIYRINDMGVRADGNGMIPIEEDWISSVLSIIRLGDGNATTDSAPQSLSVPARPAAPSVSADDESYPGDGDGILTGFDAGTAYEVLVDSNTWRDVTGTQMTGMAAGTYYVSTKAVKDKCFRSDAAEVIIGSIPATPYETPDARIDYRTDVLTGFVPDGEYILKHRGKTEAEEGEEDEGEENEGEDNEKEEEEGDEEPGIAFTADENGAVRIREDWFGGTWYIVRAGNGRDKLESLAQKLVVSERPPVPSPAGVNESAPDKKDGKLTGLTAGTVYDISGDDGRTWERKTADTDGEIRGVDAPGSYMVRVSATDSCFASLPCEPVQVYGYDDTAPVIGPLEYSYELEKTGQWLAGSKELTITVPVTEKGSGADEIHYTMTPEKGTAAAAVSAIRDGAARITVPVDFKGTIRIVCTDRVGNVSEEVTAGRELEADGFIIEDHAPQLGFRAGRDELTGNVYKTAPDLTVKDDRDDVISSGLASVRYQIGDGSVRTVSHDYKKTVVTEDSFTIPAKEIPDGETVISVTAVDQAGNSTEMKRTIKVAPPAGSGMISKNVAKGKNAPDTKLSTSEKELADMILTEAEKEQVKKGTDIKFVLDVKDAANTVSSQDKASVRAGLNGFKVGQYLDISLFKVIGESRSAISETSGKITIVINVPKNLKGTDKKKTRTFAVIRVHNGKTEILSDLDRNADTITIKTDRFSTYAICYKEQKKNTVSLDTRIKVSNTGRKLRVSWKKVSGADGYDVYAQYCKKKFTKKSIAAVKGGGKTSAVIKKINGKAVDQRKIYKIYVLAYKRVNGKKVTLGKTITAHIVGNRNTKYTNVKAVTVKKSSYSLKKGRTAKIKARTILVSPGKKQISNAHAKEFRYASTNTGVATVSAKGKIRAAGKGSCTIYVYARNGCAGKVKVKVK